MTAGPRRTVLAVPGSSARFIAKSRQLDADAIMLDLEDAVAPAAKAAARAEVVAALRQPDGWTAPTVTLRVNDWETPWTTADITTVVGAAGDRLDAIVLPKVTTAEQVVATDLILTQVERGAGWPVGRIGLEAQIEDARGLLACQAIAAASTRLVSLVFGPGDFMASVGMATLSVGTQPAGYAADAFHHALMTILLAARAHGLLAIDGPFVGIRDLAGFTASATSSAALGYDGKWVVHPDQIAAGNRIYAPSLSQVDRANRIVAAYAAANAAAGGATGAIEVDGEMIDQAGVKLARALLAKAPANPTG